MRTIKFTGQYKKDLKLARKRNLPEDKLNEISFIYFRLEKKNTQE
ncbi:MAG: hypothetical protein Q4E68_05995 [Prevotellaceae bacterium]|nr:hypothetical protein [Prevotellaceae bacterium]